MGLNVYNILCTNSNQYGSYLIINDNTQICWGTATYAISSWDEWGYCYEGAPGVTIVFPRAFSTTPHVFLTALTSTNACTGVEWASANVNGIFGCYVIRPTTGSLPSTAYIDWFAIGSP